MAALKADALKRESLNIGIKADQRSLVGRAAKVRGKNRTDFILDAARSATQEALLDTAPTIGAEDRYIKG